MCQEIIKRKLKEKNFTTIDNALLQNKNLTWGARGFLSYLLSLPSDWKIYIADLVNRAPVGEKALRTLIKELKKNRYLQRYPVYENGKISRWETFVSEVAFEKNEMIKNIKIIDGEEYVTYKEEKLLCQNRQVGETLENTGFDLLVQKVQVGKLQVQKAVLQKKHKYKKNINTKNNNVPKEEIIIEKENSVVVEKIKSLLPKEIKYSTKDLFAIIKAGQNNMEKIKQGIKAFISYASKRTIQNTIGTIITAIKENWKINEMNYQNKSSLKNFEEEEIDFDAIMAIHNKMTAKDIFKECCD